MERGVLPIGAERLSNPNLKRAMHVTTQVLKGLSQSVVTALMQTSNSRMQPLQDGYEAYHYPTRIKLPDIRPVSYCV